MVHTKGKSFQVGADPEIFIGSKGGFVSAHDKIPGDKRNPYLVHKGGVQVDGMAAEFNIDPASSYEEFQGNLDTVQSILKDMLGAEYDFLHTATVKFSEDFIEGIPNSALRLGCEPDFNGWTGVENDSPDEAALMRTAGGHVHIGLEDLATDDMYNYDHYLECARLARILDETLGVYSILWDNDDERRSLYGKAASFRPKSYGMEYRTLSNMWIFESKLVKFVYKSVEEALGKWSDKNYNPEESFQHIINNSDRGNNFFRDNPRVKELTG